MTVPIGRRYYYGTTAILNPGDEIRPAAGQAGVATDPAQALADAWRAAETGGPGVPHVYELSGPDGKPLIVIGDVLIDGTLAWRAMQIADNT
jgi:hypothetical protein